MYLRNDFYLNCSVFINKTNLYKKVFKIGIKRYMVQCFLLKSKISKEPKIFRLSSSSLFLTYPSLKIDYSRYENNQELHKEIIKQLKEKTEFYIKNYLVCVEKHKDGTPHVHVLLKLHRKCDTKNPRCLDIILEEKLFHGEYEATRSNKKALAYILKDNNFLTDMLFEVHNGKQISPEEKAFHDCQTLGSKKALENYVNKYPDRAIKKLSGLKSTLKTLEWVLKPEEQFIEPAYELRTLFYKDPKLKAFLMFLVKHDLFHRSVLFLGPGGKGKSVALKALLKELKGKKLLIRHKEQAINLTLDHDVLGFDEFNIDQFSDQDFINLIDSTDKSLIRVLYDKVEKKAGLQVILGSNKIKKLIKREEIIEAIMRRVIIIKLDNSNKLSVLNNYEVLDSIQFELEYQLAFKELEDQLPEYKKHHEYSSEHPLTIRNYKVLEIPLPKEE